MRAFEEFLSHHIEGYLFKDIESLLAVPVPDGGKGPGGVGYPLVMTVLSGVELLGVFAEALQDRQSRFDPNPGPLYFKTYWETMLYKSPPESVLRAVVHKLARHGLMHAFTTKGQMVVSKGQDGKSLHLALSGTKGVHINCDQFAEDFRRSYDQEFKPKALADLARMEVRLNDMATQYNDQATKELAKVALYLPPLKPLPITVVSVSQGVSYTETAVTSSWVK